MDESPNGATGTAVGGELLSEETSTAAQWVLLDGDRRHVAVVVLAGVALLLGGALLSGVGAVHNEDSLTRLFSSLVGGNLTLVTVAISINQLIISREFGTPDQIRDHIRDIVAYRHEVEDTAGADVSPVAADEFLGFLADQIHDHGERLHAAADDVDDPQRREAVERYAETLVAEANQIGDALDERPGGAFDTLRTILDTDLTGDVYAAELLRAHAETLPEPVERTLDDVFELVEQMGVARQYFKSLYIQRELAELSRKLLYVGLPAVAFSMLTVWVYGHPSGAALPGPALAAFVLLSTVIAAAPLAILVSYVLRVTTVTRRTASLMPFKVREESPL